MKGIKEFLLHERTPRFTDIEVQFPRNCAQCFLSYMDNNSSRFPRPIQLTSPHHIGENDMDIKQVLESKLRRERFMV